MGAFDLILAEVMKPLISGSLRVISPPGLCVSKFRKGLDLTKHNIRSDFQVSLDLFGFIYTLYWCCGGREERKGGEESFTKMISSVTDSPLEASPPASEFILSWRWLAGDRDMSSLPTLSTDTRRPVSGVLRLPRGPSLQVLPGASVAMVAPQHTQDAKNKCRVKLSSCLGKESFLFSLYLYPIGSQLMCSEKLGRIQMPCPESADGLGVERSFMG